MSVSLLPLPTASPPPPSTEPSPLRLAVRPGAGDGGLPVGALDGAWWPRSDDLLRELPSLIATLDQLWGRVTRVDVNPQCWQPLPREIPVPGHVVKVGWFTTEQDAHKLMLLSYRVGRWDLLVIPPRTSEASAARLMAAAADTAGAPTASALLATEAAHLDTGDSAGDAARDVEARDLSQEAAWESEGGTTLTAPPSPTSRPHAGRVPVAAGR